VERVGIHDNFFELGGHSLLATQVIARVREAWQCEVPLHALFEVPHVAELSILIDTIKNNKTQPGLPAIVPIPRDTRRVRASSLVLDHQLFGSEKERTI
jgi:acyl carrier protein